MDETRKAQGKSFIEMNAESAEKQRKAYERQQAGSRYARRGFLGESERFLDALIWWRHG